MGVEIFDASGKALIAVPDTKALWKAHRYPEGGVGFIQVPAHGIAEKNIALGNLYDLSQPGAYSAKIVLVDTTTNLRVESNTIKFALRSADYFAGFKEKRMIPPFMMNISYEPHPQHDGHIDPSSVGLLMCNISDHEIWMYNASGNYAEILGPSNKAAPMTDAELKLWKQYNDPAISAVHTHQHPLSNNWFQLAPHQAINFGIWTYEKSYDLSHLGRYQLRIYRYDEPDAEEGTKLIGLPKTYSNWTRHFEVTLAAIAGVRIMRAGECLHPSSSSPRAIPTTSALSPEPWPTSASPTSPSSHPTSRTGKRLPQIRHRRRRPPPKRQKDRDPRGGSRRCTLVIGTGTLTYRKPEQPVVPLPLLASFIESKCAPGAGRIALGKIGFVFGPEKHGLTREDLSHCHLLVEIPTDPLQPSMNLGQAVAVCLYELATRTAHTPEAASAATQPATAGRQELLAGLVEELMVASDYTPTTMREANRHDLRLLLHRITLTDKDARRILGLLRRVLFKLRN